MKTSTAAKLAMSSLVLAGTAVGCKPMGADRPMAVSSIAPARASAKAAAFGAEAERALAAHKPMLAVTKAEAAVALAPRDAGRRVLLGRSYLAAGRFLSAETAFQDAATLDPTDARVPVKLALAQIALGKWSEARTTLAAAQGRVPEADRGLALALAGQPDEAIAILEPAARDAGATVKTRQNLALGYALAGRWADARAVAAQDLAPAYVTVRMQEWVQFAQPHAVSQQVAEILGVTPVTDPGQPTALALAPGAPGVRTAALAPAEAALPEAPAAEPVDAATAPMAIAVADESPAPRADPAAAPLSGGPVSDGAMSDGPVADRPVADGRVADAVFLAPPSAGEAVPTLHAERGPMKQPLARLAATTAHLPAARLARHATGTPAARTPGFAPADRETGNWAVQIGAFASPTVRDAAWTRTSGGLRMLAGYTPSRSVFANMHRIALSGFGSRGAAKAMCAKLRAKGHACFVRPVAGDTPVQRVARTIQPGKPRIVRAQIADARAAMPQLKVPMRIASR